MTKKRIYIAGKITGLVWEDAWRKFAEAEEVLRRLGHDPVNPMRGDQTGTAAGEIVSGANGAWEREMERCLGELVRCEGIYLLPDWERSRGAKLEHTIARERGLTVFHEARLPYAGLKRRCWGCNTLAFRFEFRFGADNAECFICQGGKPGGEWLATAAG